jgi:KDO2-lipid IV(A) lauroyltransferase
MDLTSIINSAIGPFLGIFIGRVLGRRNAYRLGDFVAERLVSNRESETYRTIQANQSVVQGLPLDSAELDAAVRKVYRNAARGYADFYSLVSSSKEVQLSSVSISDQMVRDIRASQEAGRGVILCGAHLSSFNMVMMGFQRFRDEATIQALGAASPTRGYRADNFIRKSFGIDVTPVSREAIKKAISGLRTGGIVMTGVDRPDPNGDPLTFFGRPVRMPTGMARIALMTNSNIVPGACIPVAEGKYVVDSRPMIQPELSGDEKEDSILLTQRVLDVLEGYIKEYPEHWFMFLEMWQS